ncbi:YebC/PmpR family DNA-binding transcriptional regulator [Candidatus Hydrogenosomobacter endosymbioticus]|uniref:Probable transcriptional regulatory protein HYD_0300 n=1 Tax=Candidatus Hydrogenosomobacter endosymbioticus TaxID=2558174 RepID=A0ABM7V809_9PROT|nr:YebC/PmpR family DNA-binding transcriptional regulator [Candidatus Hydrogenosomobacter endosymbioticus]BDB95897.1 putative transcriptional regulatory protein [Candidatus Hydrogenosomobacter endosymbioticus]
MAGHSQFKNIMHRKGAQDIKRGKQFTKIIKDIHTAIKEGGSVPESNAKLRTALASARQSNVPKDTIERAIKRACGDGAENSYEDVRYEAKHQDGSAIIIEASTDNRNRTACEVRTIVNKNGGCLTEQNSVSFMFEHLGLIVYSSEHSCDLSAVQLSAIDLGAREIEEKDGEVMVFCEIEEFSLLKNSLEKEFGTPRFAEIVWSPTSTVSLQCDDAAKSFTNMIDLLEDNEDVISVWHNVDI